jgi:hypothetical protein
MTATHAFDVEAGHIDPFLFRFLWCDEAYLAHAHRSHVDRTGATALARRPGRGRRGDPARVPTAIDVSRRACAKIRQNLFRAFVRNALTLRS